MPIEILQCNVYLDMPDENQINCGGQNHHIEPKEIPISDNDKHLKPASIKKMDLRIYIPSLILECVKGSGLKKEKVQYGIHVRWKIKTEYFDTHDFNDYLYLTHVPDLNAD